MENKIKIKKDSKLEETLINLGSIIFMDNKKYIFLPFWFEFNYEDDNIYLHHLDDIPNELKIRIIKERNKKAPFNINQIINSPIIDKH